jgi:hypothetical protein
MSRGGVGIQSHHYAMYRGSQRLLCVSVWHRLEPSRGGVHRCQPSRAEPSRAEPSRAVAVSGSTDTATARLIMSCTNSAPRGKLWLSVFHVESLPRGALLEHRLEPSRGGAWYRCQ